MTRTIPLAAHLAPRSCTSCGRSATHRVLTSDEPTTLACAEHLPAVEPAGLPTDAPREIPADEVEVGDTFLHAGMTNTVKGIRRDAAHGRITLVVDTSANNQVSWPFRNGDLVSVVLNAESQAAIGHDLVEPMGEPERCSASSWNYGKSAAYGPGGYNRCTRSGEHEWHLDEWSTEWRLGFKGSFVRRESLAAR